MRVHRRLLTGVGAGEPVSPAAVSRLVRQEAPLLDAGAVERVVADVLATVDGLGPLQPLLADPGVSDVMVNGDGRVWVERAGCLERTSLVLEAAVTLRLIERVVAPLGLRVDRSSPSVDARLPDGSRVHAVVPPLAVDGPCLTIRRFLPRLLPVDAFCPPPVAALLRRAVAARLNVLVTGATSSGKTTLLNALAAAVPAWERIVTVEDAAELRLERDNVVRLEARPANAEGAGEVRLRDLLRNALRMRPDRILVGEVRGAEAFDLLLALNTGHDGSLATCHANGCADGLRRVEALALLASAGLPLRAVREQLRSALDLVVHVARVTGEGRRRVLEVGEVMPDTSLEEGLRVRRLAGAAEVCAIPQRPSRAVDGAAWHEGER